MVYVPTQSDADVVNAAVDLAGRSGATGFEFAHTDPGAGPVTWFATVEFGPDKSIVMSGYPDPVQAANAMAGRLLSGAKCKCGGLVALSMRGAWVAPEGGKLLDGTDAHALRNARQCLWMLEGDRWVSGCDAPPLPKVYAAG